MTPFEKKTGSKPDLAHIRVPGCKVYVYIPKEKRQTARVPKITPRGKLCRLLGFTSSKSIYVVYDPISKKIQHTRDVIFDEGPSVIGNSINELDVPNEDFDEDEDDVTNAPPVPYSSVFREEQKSKPQPKISIEIPRRSTRSYIDGTRLDDDELDDIIYSSALHASAGTGNKTITYEQARKSPKWPLWLVALKLEYDVLIANKVWVEVKTDGITNILPGHWVLVEKPDRLKARYVVQGNRQRPGIDYGETYAGTARSGSVKMMCAIMAVEGLSSGQLDALNAFLNSHLNGVDVYIRFPRGFEKPGYCCKLLKALYGLCQSPREWWMDFTGKIKKLGFRQCRADYSVFVNDEGVVLIIYVDDIALFAKEPKAIQAAKDELMSAYKMRDLGVLNTFIGIQIERLPNGNVFLHQTKYAKDILERFGFTIENGSKHGASTPFESTLVIVARDGTCTKDELKHYQEMVGCLNWLTTITRPDMAYAAQKLAQFNANPPDTAIQAVKRAYRYLRQNDDLGLLYSSDKELAQLIGNTDASWGENNTTTDVKSTSSCCFTYVGAPVAWLSKKQPVTATSSTEAEYVSQCSATKEAAYLRQFFSELGRPIQDATIINADNMGAITMAKNPVHQGRSRHIDFQYHYTRDKVADGTVTFNYVHTTDMVADGLTKPLASTKFPTFVDQLGIRKLSSLKLSEAQANGAG